jgi:hypothetical protein
MNRIGTALPLMAGMDLGWRGFWPGYASSTLCVRRVCTLGSWGGASRKRLLRILLLLVKHFGVSSSAAFLEDMRGGKVECVRL